MEKKNINKLASYIKQHFKDFQRFYTPTHLDSDIDCKVPVCGCVLRVSLSWGYIDILDLTEEEHKQLEEKLK